jgi:hypothetical protein
MSEFDPSAFLDATTTEALVKRPPLPAGSSFVGIIGEPQTRSWTGKKDPTKSGIAVDLKIEIDLTAYPDTLDKLGGTPKVTLQDSIMLDLKDDGRTIDYGPGKNAKLRRYREALGLNEPGKPFSIRQLQGMPILVKIKHREYENELYDEVDSVAKA